MKKIIFLYIYFFSSILVNGQPIPTQNNIPPNYNGPLIPTNIFSTPDVRSFHLINFLPVNLYTGKVNVNIPIYEIEVGKIKIPISLTYNSGGIKVDEEASSVGLGWSLNAGGSILRIIKHVEDHANIHAYQYASNGYQLVEINKGQIIRGYFTPPDITIDKTRTDDAMPDLFIVNAPGLSSSFNLELDYKRRYSGSILDGSGIKITNIERDFVQTEGLQDAAIFDVQYLKKFSHYMKSWSSKFSDYTSFTLKNIDGLEYRFFDKDIYTTMRDLNREMDINTTLSNGTAPLYTAFQNSFTSKVSCWHLNKITDPETERNVNFHYQSYINPYEKKTAELTFSSVKLKQNNVSFKMPWDFDSKDYFNLDEVGSMYEPYIRSKNIYSQKINTISWDYGTVSFLYNFDRKDIPNEKALTDIIIRDKTQTIIKHLKLSYSYFLSNKNCSDNTCRRLKLDKITDVTNSKPINLYDFEYNDLEQLPNKQSLKQDYLGFYNNSDTTSKISEMFFYPNRGIYSILPFKLNEEYTKISQGRSLEANTYSLLGLLSKINYPTGGSVTFEYENHKHDILGYEVVAGGARLKKQIICNNNGEERAFTYNYINTNGKTSGSMCYIPRYTEITRFKPDEMVFRIYQMSRSEVELTDGGYVGYSRIIEKEEGNGYKEYLYYSPVDYPNEREVSLNGSNKYINVIINNSLYPGVVYLNNDARRGKLRKEKIYNNKDQLLKKIDYEYEYKEFDIKPNEFNITVSKSNININEKIIQYRFKINTKIERNLLSKVEIEESFNNSPLNNITKYIYDDSYPLIKEKKTLYQNDSIKIQYKYPIDYKNLFPYSDMVYKNILSPVIEEITLRNDKEINKVKTNYTNDIIKTFGINFPSSIQTIIGENVTTELSYDLYDSKGNLLQYTNKDGVSVSYLWSYRKQYPIAEIKNATYATVRTLLDKDPERISNLDQPDMSQINALRDKLPNAMVTTYTYKPLVGILTATNPAGVTTYYVYDSFNRLKETYIIENGKKRVVEAYNYHYANQ